jgi:tetratricopeptide (TPR) repeat protein
MKRKGSHHSGTMPRAGFGRRAFAPSSGGAGFLAVLLAVAVAPAVAQPLPAERQREILREALNAYDHAVAAARAEPQRAADLYRQAAAGFEALLDSGLRNAALEYNLGNVYFRLGELGRAILHYRRAERLAPREERLRANLRYARNRVEPALTPSGQARLTRQLLFWHYETSPVERQRALVLFATVGWSLLWAWLWWRRRALVVGGLIGVAVTAALATSLYAQQAAESRQPEAVVIRERSYLRLGRSEAAEPALKQPLGSGVEVRVLQRRGDWVEVRLPGGQTGWLPESAIEIV